MHLYNRSKHCSIQVHDDAYHITSVMIDDFHEMILDIVVGVEDAVIRETSFTMRRIPYDYCKGAQILAEEMKGIRIGPGISAIAKEKLGGPLGCSHLFDLFMEALKVHVQGIYRLRVLRKDTEGIAVARKKMKGSCYYYSNDSVHENVKHSKPE